MNKQMLNAAKHAMYDNVESRWMNRRRIQENAEFHNRKMSKHELEDMSFDDDDYEDLTMFWEEEND